MNPFKDAVAGQIAQELAAAARGQRNAIVDRWAARIGVSPRTLRRRLEPLVPRTRKPRADRGRSRISEEQVAGLAALQRIATERSRSPFSPGGGRKLPAQVAIDTGVAAGIIDRGISPTRFNRLARELGLRAPEPVRRFQAPYANCVHQLDYSVSSCFAFAGFDGDGVPLVRRKRDGLERYNAAKGADPQGRKVWIIAWVDDHSGARFSSYFVSPGEDTAVILSTLLSSWTGDHRADSIPFGVPKLLYLDKGPAHGSELFRSCLASLVHPETGQGVRIVETGAQNPQAKGKVERIFGDHKTSFEGRFWIDPRESVYRLDELNRLQLEFCAARNRRPHRSIPGLSRFHAWQRSARAIAVPGPDAWLNAWETDTRTVGRDLAIRFGGVLFKAPAELAGRKVKVIHSLAGEVFAEDLETAKAHPCPPFEFETFGGDLGMAAPAAVERLRRSVESLRGRAMPQPRLGEGQQLTVVQMRGQKKEAGTREPFETANEFENVEAAARFVLGELDVTEADLGGEVVRRIRERIEAGGLSRKAVAELAARFRDGEPDTATAASDGDGA